MKKIFLLMALAFLPRKAHAQALQEFITLSSATWWGVTVSTSASTRIDNFNGNGPGLLTGRSALKYTNPSTSLVSVYCGFDGSVSSFTVAGSTVSRQGEEVVTGAKVE